MFAVVVVVVVVVGFSMIEKVNIGLSTIIYYLLLSVVVTSESTEPGMSSDLGSSCTSTTNHQFSFGQSAPHLSES